MSLTCAACGSDRVTETVETADGLAALCEVCYESVSEKARKFLASDAAARRLHLRKLKDSP